VWCGDAGWIDLDPTNDRLCGVDHIPIAWGRDYSDVTPISGVFPGGATTSWKSPSMWNRSTDFANDE
jgi:transglutaminase-like putative cysteine protease